MEVSKIDLIKFGVVFLLCESGDIKNLEVIILVGLKGSIYKKKGLIIVWVYIYMMLDDVEVYGVKNG